MVLGLIRGASGWNPFSMSWRSPNYLPAVCAMLEGSTLVLRFSVFFVVLYPLLTHLLQEGALTGAI